ncbi:hypothetical protein [Clostridium sp. BL8]|nr:hypothetical protein [Clostridium sp. BL8]
MRHDWMTSGHGRYHVKVVNSNGNDFSQVFWSDYFYASTPSGTVARIPNYSYEDRGVGMIKLKGEGRGGAAGTGMWYAKGVWSPDSV